MEQKVLYHFKKFNMKSDKELEKWMKANETLLKVYTKELKSYDGNLDIKEPCELLEKISKINEELVALKMLITFRSENRK